MGEITFPPITNLKFTVHGQPIVKKNNQKVVTRGGKTFKVDTPAYTRWRNSAYFQIAQALGKPEPIPVAINLRVHFYMETRTATDISNLLEGIQDVLVTSRILADDNYMIVAGLDGTRAYYDKNNPRMEVEITPIEV